MVNEFKLDVNIFLQNCHMNDSCDSDVQLSVLMKLEAAHSLNEMTDIYFYLLQHSKTPDVIIYVLKKINKYRPLQCFGIVLDLLLFRGVFPDNLSAENDVINLRVNAAKVISNYKDTRAVVPIMDCLNNKNENYKIRLACAEALGKIGDRYAVTPLIDIVSDEDEKSVYVRESAAMALGMIGDMRAIDSLVGILEAKKTFLNKFTFLKERVIEALGKINRPNKRVFAALKNSLNDESPQIRINAIEALMNSGDLCAVEMIMNALSDKDEEVVENAVIALYNLEGADLLYKIINGAEFSDIAKDYAQSVIDEYETDDEE